MRDDDRALRGQIALVTHAVAFARNAYLH